MNFRTNLLKVSLAILLTYAGCKENPTEPETTSAIIGTVLRKSSNVPIQGATITDLGKKGGTATTDSVGAFTLSVGVLTSTYSTTIVTEATGFINDTSDVEIEAGKDKSITVRLDQYSIGPITSGSTGQAASIELVLQSDRSLSVRNAGGTEKALLTFAVMDSLGYALTSQKAVMVRFNIIGGRLGGEFLLPDSVETNSSGLASTVVTSGTKSRVLQVVASVVVSGSTITSSPAQLTISGGLPDSVRSTMWTSSKNFPGLSGSADLLGTVSAMLVDQYGNPVQVGNLAYFESTGGSIDAIGITDATGLTKVNLYGGGKPPVAGIDTIKVTVNRVDGSFSKFMDVTFSGTPIIRVTNVPNDSINIFDGTGQTLDLAISDANGNPLAAGNKISVITGGLVGNSVKISGDVGATTPDTRNTSLTSYKIRIDDGTADGGDSGPFTLQLMVSGPNGSASKFIYGILQPPQAIITPSASQKLPAQIAFVSVSTPNINVSGTGSIENSVITYEVRDSLGMLIESNPRAFAHFSIEFYPNTLTNVGTEPTLIPSADSTDDNARLRVSIRSGTQAGVVQVFARIDLGGGRYVISQPVKISVHAGHADQRHFTLASKYYNFPGLELANYSYVMTVHVVDQYSNPVLKGTAVYYNTMHGSIGTGNSKRSSEGTTDLDGFVEQDLWSGNPYPEFGDAIDLGPGYSWVYARTLGENSTWVRDSVLMLWTGSPMITEAEGNPAVFAVPNDGSAGPWSFSITDKYGHPMSQGTNISVSCGDAVIDGNANITLGDHIYGGSGITDFTVIASDSDPLDGKPPKPALLVVTVNHPVYGIRSWVIASGTTD